MLCLLLSLSIRFKATWFYSRMVWVEIFWFSIAMRYSYHLCSANAKSGTLSSTRFSFVTKWKRLSYLILTKALAKLMAFIIQDGTQKKNVPYLWFSVQRLVMHFAMTNRSFWYMFVMEQKVVLETSNLKCRAMIKVSLNRSNGINRVNYIKLDKSTCCSLNSHACNPTSFISYNNESLTMTNRWNIDPFVTPFCHENNIY